MDNLLVAIDASSEGFSEETNGSMVDYPASLLREIRRCPGSIGMTVRDGSERVSGMHRNHCPESVGIGILQVHAKMGAPSRYTGSSPNFLLTPFFYQAISK